MLKILTKITGNILILPFYHLVDNEAPAFVKSLYKPRTIVQFNSDLDFFLKHYTPINLEEVIQFNQGKITLEKPSFHLTFDDGLSNFYHVVAPILKKRNIPATVFLNTDFVDNKDLFYRYKEVLFGEVKKRKQVPKEVQKNKNTSIQEAHVRSFLADKKPYLSLEQIKELQQEGFTFGAHSVNHPLYANISLKEQIRQTLESNQWIDRNLKEKHKAFSFPFHDIGVSKQFFIEIKDKVAITFGSSAINLDEIKTNLQRLDMEKSGEYPCLFLFKKQVFFLLKKMLNRHIISRK